MLPPESLTVLELVLPLIIGLLAYYARALDGMSSFTGVVMGYLIIFSPGTSGEGFNWFLVFLTFFVVSSLATNYRYEEKTKYNLSQKKRGIENVLGNGLVPILFVLGGNIYGFFAALATSTADTLSSEIGVLSPSQPVSVLDFKTKVKRGADGGVSVIGNTFMFFGAGLIGFLGIILFDNWILFWITLWGGVFGCTLDSTLGATLEKKGIIGNSSVNFFTTLGGGLLAFILSLAL